jgi:putative transposase
MARIARIVVPGRLHHIVQRGVRRMTVFFRDDDRDIYARLLRKFSLMHGFEIAAYTWMRNHIHVVGVPARKESLALAIGDTHKTYTRLVNKREGWKGYLWQGRFFSCPLEGEYLWDAIKYVERNPVRAGIVERAEDYPWSSARAHVLGTDDDLLAPRYRELGKGWAISWGEFLAIEPDGEKEREMALHFRTGRPLGSDAFITELERETGRVLKKRRPGRKPSGYLVASQDVADPGN